MNDQNSNLSTVAAPVVAGLLTYSAVTHAQESRDSPNSVYSTALSIVLGAMGFCFFMFAFQTQANFIPSGYQTESPVAVLGYWCSGIALGLASIFAVLAVIFTVREKKKKR